jgi:glutathione peroxidase
MSAALFGASSVYEFTMNSIDNQPMPLAKFEGKVMLIVNVASKCGFTPQYEQLEAVYEKYKEQGFVIVGFPANNFMAQEPGTNEEIKTFCSTKYNVKFPLYSKISVKGEDKAPLYEFLRPPIPRPAARLNGISQSSLVDRNGKVIARFESAVKPDSPEVTAAIENALKH